MSLGIGTFSIQLISTTLHYLCFVINKGHRRLWTFNHLKEGAMGKMPCLTYIPSQPNQIIQEVIVDCYKPYAAQLGQVGQTVDRWGC